MFMILTDNGLGASPWMQHMHAAEQREALCVVGRRRHALII